VRDLSQPTFKPDALMKMSAEAGAGQVLTKAVLVAFEPNKSVLNPEYDTTFRHAGGDRQAGGQIRNAYIIIEGNTDASRKGIVPTDLVRQLSYDRADAVRKAIMEKYQFDRTSSRSSATAGTIRCQVAPTRATRSITRRTGAWR